MVGSGTPPELELEAAGPGLLLNDRSAQASATADAGGPGR